MKTTRIRQCPEAINSWLFLPLCVRGNRREQLTESRDIENGTERTTWQEL